MPKYRRATAAENAAVDALQYEYIGGGPPPTVPARKTRRAKTADGPVYVHLVVQDDPDGRWDVLGAFRLLAQAARAAATASAGTGSEVAVLTVLLLDDLPTPTC